MAKKVASIRLYQEESRRGLAEESMQRQVNISVYGSVCDTWCDGLANTEGSSFSLGGRLVQTASGVR